jgi:hypothetical protein
MLILLLSLLVFASIVTMIGFFLTTKLQARNQQATYAITPRSREVVDPVPLRGRRVVDPLRLPGRHSVDSAPVPRRGSIETVPMRSRRIVVDNELRAAKYSSIPAILRRIGGRHAGEPIPWSVITIGLISISILGIYAFNFLFSHQVLFNLVWFNQSASAAQSNPQPTYHATENLVRIGQVDPAQYRSQQEFKLWAYSACSAAAMTEVINAYGNHYRITDILKVEAQIGEITPQLGLLEDIGIQRTVALFGFKTTWGHSLTLDQIIDIANHGRPVIVSFPPDRYAGGHLLVVTGGDSSKVLLADSSLWNRHSLSRSQFLSWWEGFSAIVTPA